MRPSDVLGCALVLLCALLQYKGCLAIKCWVCRSDLDPRCVDPFDNTTLPIYDCTVDRLPHLPDVKATMCRKIRQKVYGHWRFIRSCAFLGSPGEGTGDENYCTMRTGTYNVFVETCTCNSKDGCNAAAPHVPTPISLLLPILIPAILADVLFPINRRRRRLFWL